MSHKIRDDQTKTTASLRLSRMKTAFATLFLCFLSSAAAFSVVKPSTASWVYQRPTIVKGTRLFAEKDSPATAVLERESTATVSTVDNNVVVENSNPSAALEKKEPEEELSETQKLMQQVKDAGTAGVISYALWELGFWAVSVPVVLFGYLSVTGHFPDLSNKEDTAKLGAEAFAFVNFARFAVPLRIGLALSTTPWIQKNIVDRFFSKTEKEQEEEAFQ